MDKEIGAGRYGTVFKTIDKVSGKRFALKLIKMEGETQGFPVTAIREIRILKALDHENIIRLEEVITYGNEQPDDKDSAGSSSSRVLQHTQGSEIDLSQFLKGSVFMVFEYVEFDMSALILSMKCMTPDHVKCYMKQLLSGIFYMHRQKILHRDLKTANILITRGNVLKIADWGLARSIQTNMHRLSPKVVTLWYRSPELLLETKKYGPEIDMWSVGCIFGELVCSQAILPGSVELEQLEKIYQLCGTPPADSEVESRLQQCEGWSKMQYETTYPSRIKQKFASTTIGHTGIDLIEKLLCLHPEQRITAMDALDHEYFWERQGTLSPDGLPTLNLEDAHEAEVTKKRQKKAAEQKAKAKSHQGGGGRGGGSMSKYRLTGRSSSSSTSLNRHGRPQHQPSRPGAGMKAAAASINAGQGGAVKRSYSERTLPPPAPTSHMHKSSSSLAMSSSSSSSAVSSRPVTAISSSTSAGAPASSSLRKEGSVLPPKPPFPPSTHQKKS